MSDFPATHARPDSHDPISHAEPAPAHRISGGDVSAGLKWAWSSFTSNLGAFLVPGLVYGATAIVVIIGSLVASVAALRTAADAGGSANDLATAGITLGSLALVVVISVIAALWLSGILAAGTEVLRGGRPTIARGFRGSGTTIAVLLVITVVIQLLNQLGSFNPLLGFAFSILTIAVSFLTYFAAQEAAKGASFGEAFSTSAKLASQNLGTVVLTILLSIALCLTMIIPLLAVATIPVLNLTVLGVHHRVQGHALHEPVKA